MRKTQNSSVFRIRIVCNLQCDCLQNLRISLQRGFNSKNARDPVREEFNTANKDATSAVSAGRAESVDFSRVENKRILWRCIRRILDQDRGISLRILMNEFLCVNLETRMPIRKKMRRTTQSSAVPTTGQYANFPKTPRERGRKYGKKEGRSGAD